MARVQLSFAEIKDGLVPPVCPVCGEPATGVVERTFRHLGDWSRIILLFVAMVTPILLLIAGPIAWLLMPRRTIPLPVCDRHRNHWRNRLRWMVVPMSAFGIVAAAAITFLIVFDRYSPMYEGAGPLLVASLSGVVISLIAAVVIERGLVKCDSLTDRDIGLIRVHERLVQAVRDARFERRYAFDDEEDDRPRRRRMPDPSDEHPRPRVDSRDTYRERRDDDSYRRGDSE